MWSQYDNNGSLKEWKNELIWEEMLLIVYAQNSTDIGWYNKGYLCLLCTFKVKNTLCVDNNHYNESDWKNLVLLIGYYNLMW